MHTNLFIYYSSRQLNRLLRTSVFHHKVFQDEIISAPLPKICGFVFLRRISLKTLITSQKPGAWKTKCKSAFQWEGIKGLILRHCGKLNSTHPGKLLQLQQATDRAFRLLHCGCRNAWAAVHKHTTLCTAAAPVDKICKLFLQLCLAYLRQSNLLTISVVRKALLVKALPRSACRRIVYDQFYYCRTIPVSW